MQNDIITITTYIAVSTIMRCAKREWFSKKKKKKFLPNGGYERVECLFLISSASVCLCVIQHRLRPRSSTALKAQGTNTGPDGSAHIPTSPSCAYVVVSRSELVEPGAATCVFRGMAGPCFKSLERIVSQRFFLRSGKKKRRARAIANSRPPEREAFGSYP